MAPTSTLVGGDVLELTDEVALGIPTKADVICAIREESEAAGVPCDEARAETVYLMLVDAVGTIQGAHHNTMYHLTEQDLAVSHDVLEVVMIGNSASPADDTAHGVINRHFGIDDDKTLVHTIDTVRGAQYCAVAIRLRDRAA